MCMFNRFICPDERWAYRMYYNYNSDNSCIYNFSYRDPFHIQIAIYLSCQIHVSYFIAPVKFKMRPD